MNNNFLSFVKDAQNKGDLKYLENHPLSSVSSMGTGGKARFFVTPHTAGTLIETLKAAEKSSISYALIGNATNVLFSDDGFDGAVISTKRINGIYLKDGMIYVESGTSLPALSGFALENGFSGFEGLVSIPATVGGALTSNAGAFGCEIADRLVSFSVYIPSKDRIEVRTPKSHPFSYRKSSATDGGAVILSASFSADVGDRDEIFAKMMQNKEKRKLTQPIGVKSVGSFFKRPSYTEENKAVSVAYYGKSAGELIDLCGLKGKRAGGAEVSKKHAGFIINSGNATTGDVLALANEVKKAVFEKTGVKLCEECVKIEADKKQNV